MATDDELLGPSSAGRYLVSRGVLRPGTLKVEVLGGGVSNVVLAATDSYRRVVLKQALARLRVPDEWRAPIGRAMAEADALELVAGLTPANVPRLLDRDPARHAMVIEKAPSNWVDWKSLLLKGYVHPEIAAQLGEVLARWHSQTVAGTSLPPSLQGSSNFELLRVDPYYRTVARRSPEVRAKLLSLAEQLLSRKVCLVHGDFSPKNVLVGGHDFWVVDFEVAHLGDPAFDVAFMLSHLVLKSLHMPAYAPSLDACMLEFTSSYEAHLDRGLEVALAYVLSHVASLLLARVKGKSPVEYLDGPEQEAAWALGTDLLRHPPETLGQLFSRRDEVRP